MEPGIKILGIRADWKALSFCLLAASTFWFFNAMNHDYTVDILYPLEISYDDSAVVPVSKLPTGIKINVSGNGWRLLRKNIGFKGSPIVYHPTNLPLKTFVASDELIPLLSRQISSIKFNYIVKDTVFFEFDYLREKKVKVLVDSATINLSDAYQITSPIIINPDHVIFQGPYSFLTKVPDTIRVAITSGDIKDDFEEDIKIPEKGYPKVEMLNKEVKVRFEVNKFEKQSTVVPLSTINFPRDSNRLFFEKELILTYFIKEEDKNKVSANDFAAFLNYRDLDKTDSTIAPKLIKELPFIKNYYFTPYVVKIKSRQ